ncbi:DUF2244 domain-containing protein [Pelagibius sp. CAU 1746]|uniref:DUF2244 domain-containing protein n=1 Tax=Pelagibius sp. CAU 1746 TaxID=3140370 RepID=UPI00325BBDE0
MTAICRPAPVEAPCGPSRAPGDNPPPEARDKTLFDAELRPHRSLSPRGFLLLMAGVCAISFTGGLAFWLAGAWPVIGFLGADVLLIYLAFKASYRSGRMVETLQLTPRTLTVRRTWPGGRSRCWEFQPYWLQVDLADPPRHDSPLVLRSHGQSLAIGSFLTKEERAEVAEALRAALVRARAACRPA